MSSAERAPKVSALADLPFEKFTQLTISTVDGMTGFVPQPWSHIISEPDWKSDDSKLLKQDFIKIITEATYLSDEKRAEYLQTYFDNDKKEYLANYIVSNKLNLAKTFLKQHNASVDDFLDDFNWSVKWILGDSSSTVAKYPLVTLHMTVLSRNEKKNISLELTKNELDKLLNTLEANNK